MMQKEIIIVDGRPVNLEAVSAKYRDLLDKQKIDQFTPPQIAAADARMKLLQARRSELDAQIAQLRAQGVVEEHPDMRQLRERQEQADAEIERYAVEWRDLQTKMADGARWFGGQRLTAPVREIPPAAGGGGDGMRGMRAGTAGMVGGVQLDLVNLANTMVDAAGAVRVAKVNVAARKKLAQANGFTNVELATEEANLETAAKRLELLKGIAAIALEGASAEFERTNQRYQTGMEGQREVLEAQSKMKMLQLIVKSAE
jgi:hypothetical protein